MFWNMDTGEFEGAFEIVKYFDFEDSEVDELLVSSSPQLIKKK